jgi:hypothetical protein
MRMQSYSQGDLLPSVREMAAVGPDGYSIKCAHEGVVIVSQTCDVVQDRVELIHVAEHVVLNDKDARTARSGRWIRYVALPALGPNHFADLAHICAVHKAVAAADDPIPGLSSDDDRSTFGKAVGRHFNRFAYPDEVSAWFDELAKSIRSKTGKLNSPEGRILENVIQFRIQSLNGWGEAPFDLRLIVIVKPSTLPMFADDLIPPFSEGSHTWAYGVDGNCRRAPSEIAERIEASADAAEIYWLWATLGDAWAAKCCFKGRNACYDGSILGITSDVLSADQFTMTMQVDSEIMDLDHLGLPIRGLTRSKSPRWRASRSIRLRPSSSASSPGQYERQTN